MSEYRYFTMTGRPRPVTATVTKPKWMELSDSPTRRRSLDSTGSTASLCSVLDHDSYISSVSSDEEDLQQEFNDMNIEEGPIDSPLDKESADKHYEPYSRSKSPNTLVRKQNQHEDEFQGLSPWEKWLLVKTQEERIKKKLELRSKNLKDEEIQKTEAEKKRKQLKIDEEIKIWKERKNEQEKIQKKLEKRLKETEKDCNEKEKSQIDEKAAKKYKEWAKTKKIEERKQKREAKEKLKKESENEEERKRLAEEKYKEWYKNAKKRPKSAPANTSHGYLAGKLTDYHDTNAYPEPSYCNPIPWQPIKIPKQKSTAKVNIKKKTSKSKYMWNPDKYY